MRVLITGVSGFTGQWLVKTLRAHNCEIFGLCTDAGSVELDGDLVADLGDQERIASWLSDVRPTHIVHLAALSHIVGAPLDFYRVNLLGTESFVRAIDAARLPLESLVVASSANIYGSEAVSPIGENQPVRPVNHYGLSKASMELMLANWKRRLPITITRPFNYTGPGQSEHFVFSKIVGAFRREQRTLTLGNIKVARDLSDVRDICEFYWRLLNAPATGATVNLCSGMSVSLETVIDVMAKIAGYRPELATDPALVRPDDIATLCGDPGRLEKLVGGLRRTPLETTLADMYGAADFLTMKN